MTMVEPRAAMTFEEFEERIEQTPQMKAAIKTILDAGFDKESVPRFLLGDLAKPDRYVGKGETDADETILRYLQQHGPVVSATGDCIDLLADVLGLARNTVRISLARLDGLGAVVRDARRGQGIYRVELP